MNTKSSTSRPKIHSFPKRNGHRKGLATIARLLALGLVAGLTPLLNAGPASAVIVSESEPNGTVANADLLGLGQTMQGTASASDTSDTDYYKVSLPSAGRLNIRFTFPSDLGTGSAYGLSVINQSGTTVYSFSIDAGDYAGASVSDKGMYLPAGDTYIRVYGWYHDATWGKVYNLTATETPGNVETETNGTTATADPIALGTTVAGSAFRNDTSDDDYYKVTLTTAGRLGIGFTFPNGLGTGDAYRVYLLNQAGTIIYSESLSGGDYAGSRLSSEGMYLPAGDFYVRIYGWYRNASWGKTYNLTVTNTPGSVETETNDTTATADPLALGSTVAGSALGDDTSDYDYFALDLSSAATVSINLAFPSGLGTGNSYQVAVYNQAGTELKDVQLTGANWNGSWLSSQRVALAAGRSYIRVYGWYRDATWGKTYQLTAALALSKTPAPKISGKAKVGKTLKATTKAWAPGPVSFAYQWLRNGRAIPGATGSRYKVVKADKKKKLSVRVTGSRAGYLPVSQTSGAKKIR